MDFQLVCAHSVRHLTEAVGGLSLCVGKIWKEQQMIRDIMGTMIRIGFIERRGKIEDLDRSFDLQFWQGQPAAARAAASWELALNAAKVKGLDVRQLRLQRSVESLQRQEQ